MEYNIYCDESCHLEHDNINVMIIGGVYCEKNKVKDINRRIIEIKERHGVNQNVEIKWTKISELKEDLYIDIINYFFDDDDLHFRCIIADKTKLKHQHYHQTHDDWYYKMYFNMLKVIFDPDCIYNIYIDIKDTNSYVKSQKLLDVCRNQKYDFSGKILKKIQPIRSHEVQLMQIVDILSGAIGYANRTDLPNERNQGKVDILNLIKKRSKYSLTQSTLYRENKINIFKWEPDYEKH